MIFRDTLAHDFGNDPIRLRLEVTRTSGTKSHTISSGTSPASTVSDSETLQLGQGASRIGATRKRLRVRCAARFPSSVREPRKGSARPPDCGAQTLPV